MVGKKTLGIYTFFLICIFFIAGCTTHPESTPPVENIASPTPSKIEIHPTETPIPTATNTPSPTKTPGPTPTPADFHHVENADGSWGVEYLYDYRYQDDTFSLYHAGEEEPFLVQNIFAYYEDHPDQRDIFKTNMSPIPAQWSEPLWSPNGRYLAFLGAIAGPSSDVYVFDTETETISRLTTGENQATDIIWSPDSQWILHSEDVSEARSDALGYWAVKADGSETWLLYHPDGFPNFLLWTDDSNFYVYDGTMMGIVSLRFVDLSANQVTVVFRGVGDDIEGSVDRGFIIDPESKTIVYQLSVYRYSEEEGYNRITDGYYISTLNHIAQRLVVPDTEPGITYNFIDQWEESLGVFITRSFCDGDPDLYYAVTPQGEIFCIEYDN